MDELSALIWLNDCADSRTAEATRLFERLGTAERIASAPRELLEQHLSASLLMRLTTRKNIYESRARADLADLVAKGVEIVALSNPTYPESLRRIPDPPLVLFVRGELPGTRKCVAVIGTRAPTHYGSRLAREIGSILVTRGYVVVSGLARGIDTQAHHGALDAQGMTIAVLAGPINYIWPPENLHLATDIERNGALIAEISPIPEITKSRFVGRNRITSGLSEALVVVEAGDDGGSVHQVRYASQQGRRILVATPQETAPPEFLKGYRAIVAMGAEPFVSAQEVSEKLAKPAGTAPSPSEIRFPDSRVRRIEKSIFDFTADS